MTSANFWIDPVRTLPWWRAFNEDGDFFLYHEIGSQYFILEGKASVALVETPVLTRTHHLHLPRFGLHFCGAIIVSVQSGGQHQDASPGIGFGEAPVDRKKDRTTGFRGSVIRSRLVHQR